MISAPETLCLPCSCSNDTIVSGSPLGCSEVKKALEPAPETCALASARSGLSTIFVLDPYNVVLSQIWAALDFNEVERNLPRIA
jgi:hypothetical protein